MPRTFTLSVRLGLMALVTGVALSSVGCKSSYNPEEDWQGLGRFTRTGVYVGGGYTRGFEDLNLQGNIDADDDDGFHVKAGYRGSRYVAVELAYDTVNEFDTDVDGVSVEASTVTANLKIYPTGGLENNAARIQPYGLAGIGIIFTDTDSPTAPSENEDAGAYRLAVGADIYLTEDIFLNAEYAWLGSTAGRLKRIFYNNLNLGILFKF